MAIGQMKSNPGFLSDQELADSFCVRTAEAEMLVETLRESTGKSNPNLIVVGPRCRGKTTLLLRTVVEVRRDRELSSPWFLVVFAEESQRRFGRRRVAHVDSDSSRPSRFITGLYSRCFRSTRTLVLRVDRTQIPADVLAA